MKTKALTSFFCAALVAPFVLAAAEPISIESLLHEMVDHEAVTRFPESNFRLKQESSYNRASKTPDDAKGWFNNKDHNTKPTDHSFIRIDEVNGEKEWVLMDHTGAGTLVRSWMPFRNIGKPTTDLQIRIYVDGATEPTLEGNMLGLLDGTDYFPFPFAHKSLASAVSFFPIPYQHGLKITTTDYPFFYVLNYREYPEGTRVKSFTVADYEAAAPLIAEVGEKLLLPTVEAAGESVGFSASLASGESASIDLAEGTAAIRELSVKLANYDELSVTRTTVLKIEFDGMETVWCPIGDFFGSGIGLNPHQGWYRTVEEDGTMRCRWVMPYQGSATVSLVNFGSAPVDAVVEVKTGAYEWDARSMYFNAGWRGQYPVPTRPYSDWNYITATGRGVFVGDTLTVMNPVEKWWGEGDEKVWIDGESFPSLFGTGTEDYYGYSWGGQSTDFYEHPFHAQPRAYLYNKLNRKMVQERNTLGYSVETRSRSLDTMPFGSSIQLDMEVWSWTDCDMGYGVGIYWYGFADTRSNRQPEPVEVLNVPPLPKAYFTAGKNGVQSATDPFQGAIEIGPEIVSSKSPGLDLMVHERSPKKFWNQGNYLFAKSEVGDFIEFQVTAQSPVAETLLLNATTASDMGILKISVNGQAAKQTVDLYSKKVAATDFIDLGVFDPVDGGYLVRVEVVGKNRKSKAAYLTLDCIQLQAAQ